MQSALLAKICTYILNLKIPKEQSSCFFHYKNDYTTLPLYKSISHNKFHTRKSCLKFIRQPQTVDKLSGTCNILFLYFKVLFIAIKTTGKPIFDIRLACALFVKINSNVQTYADEFIFAKSTLISRPLPACRHFCLHAEGIILTIIPFGFYFFISA